VGAFSRIGDDDLEAAAALVAAADVVVLCSFPVGAGNLGNLRLADRARKLLVLDPGPGDVPRTFFSGEAREAFTALEARAEVLPYESIVGEVKAAGSRGTAGVP
jgi:iron complex transport system ATP-binding protein